MLFYNEIWSLSFIFNGIFKLSHIFELFWVNIVEREQYWDSFYVQMHFLKILLKVLFNIYVSTWYETSIFWFATRETFCSKWFIVWVIWRKVWVIARVSLIGRTLGGKRRNLLESLVLLDELPSPFISKKVEKRRQTPTLLCNLWTELFNR